MRDLREQNRRLDGAAEKAHIHQMVRRPRHANAEPRNEKNEKKRTSMTIANPLRCIVATSRAGLNHWIRLFGSLSRLLQLLLLFIFCFCFRVPIQVEETKRHHEKLATLKREMDHLAELVRTVKVPPQPLASSTVFPFFCFFLAIFFVFTSVRSLLQPSHRRGSAVKTKIQSTSIYSPVQLMKKQTPPPQKKN